MMSRGLFIFALQIFVCLAVACLGIWTMFRPKSFQAFVNENFRLLPTVKPGIRPTTILIRLSSLFLLWYALTLARTFGGEIRFIGHIINRLAG